MVIDIINIERIAFDEAEDHAPVSPHSYTPKSFEVAFERVQAEARHVHLRYGGSNIKSRQNIAQLGDVFRCNASGVVVLKQPFQPLVADIFIIAQCNPWGYTLSTFILSGILGVALSKARNHAPVSNVLIRPLSDPLEATACELLAGNGKLED